MKNTTNCQKPKTSRCQGYWPVINQEIEWSSRKLSEVACPEPRWDVRTLSTGPSKIRRYASGWAEILGAPEQH